MNNRYEYSDIFSRSNLFGGLEESDLVDIYESGHKLHCKEKTILFQEGTPALRCYLVLNGRLKLSKMHEDGKEAIVRYINPGEMTAAISVFNGRDYPVTAQAVGPCEVVGWGKEKMLKLMSVYPQLAVNLLGMVIERLDDIQSRYLELQSERVEQRIARSLLRIMKKSGIKTDEGILIDFRLSRQDLADYTGTTLYTVSRTLSAWEKKGWVRSGRERIVVTNPHAMVAFAETG